MVAKLEKRPRFQRRKSKREAALPFTKMNYYILASGVLLVVLGFLAMGEGSVEGTLPLVVAPILLVIGYCVIIPIGILYRKKSTVPPGAQVFHGSEIPPP
jgi:hypothetical protein